jgi:hypothetical protein
MVNKDSNLFEGSYVVLTLDHDPWYQSGNLGIPEKYIPQDFTSDDDPYKQDGIQKYAKYKSDVKLDLTKYDLGLGHSILDRKLKMENKNNVDKVENFSTSDNTNRNILLVLLFIIIMIYLYKKYYCKKN